MRRPPVSAFTIVEALILLGTISVLIALLLPLLHAGRRNAQKSSNQTQLRGIHRSFVVWTQSSKHPVGPYYPGLNRETGQVIPDGERTGFSGDGTQPAARLAPLIAANFITPDYIINPNDKVKKPIVFDQTPTGTQSYAALTNENYSYSMLALPGSENTKAEWQETLNPAAVVLSDRAIGSGPNDISSVWTDPDSGAWLGGIVRNDNSTSREETHILNDTQYGEGDINPLDDVFADEPDADDGFLVHEDATTAYSAE
ncbi:hypothetical protein [Algisphaera agarilytica]|uniref:Type II secretory pathway pseudopilin PulG n=1 Tax=Algisphaera agarilytica TaxID=1385975 RepID=A0A7X0LK89_9BACT|nr:hypothetical protein [Algisphaera agarilytica]MBB6429391.1 type II secretory pathway pseudopilin PulG [Algisphaera agarilytica]